MAALVGVAADFAHPQVQVGLDGADQAAFADAAVAGLVDEARLELRLVEHRRDGLLNFCDDGRRRSSRGR